MKYIISENRLESIMTEYLNSLILDKDIINNQAGISVHDMDKEYFTYFSGRRELFTLEDFLDTFEGMFGLNRPQSLKFILHWFGNQFGVKVRKSMPSF